MPNTDPAFDRPMPNDDFTEGGLIGTVLFNQSAEMFNKLNAIVKPEMFYKFIFREIWRAMGECVEKGNTPDIVNVYQFIDKTKVDETEARVTMAQECNDNFSLGTPIWLARRVSDDYLRRRAINQANAAINAAHMGAEVGDIKNALELEIPTTTAEESLTHMGDALQTAISEIETRMHRGDEIDGITTGLLELDGLFDGFKPGQFILLAARPAVGKTAIALYFAQAAAQAGHPVGYVSLEMRGVDLVKRTLSNRADITLDRIIRGDLNDFQWNAISKSLSDILPIYYTDSVYNIDAIEMSIREMRANHGVEFVVVDYLQLMEGRPSKDNNREREIAQMSRRLKILAMELGIPILALSQLNRGAADREPRTSDLRESGALEQDGDIVILLDRPAMRGQVQDDDGFDQSQLMTINVAKHRNGEVKKFHYKYAPSTNCLYPWD